MESVTLESSMESLIHLKPYVLLCFCLWINYLSKISEPIYSIHPQQWIYIHQWRRSKKDNINRNTDCSLLLLCTLETENTCNKLTVLMYFILGMYHTDERTVILHLNPDPLRPGCSAGCNIPHLVIYWWRSIKFHAVSLPVQKLPRGLGYHPPTHQFQHCTPIYRDETLVMLLPNSW